MHVGWSLIKGISLPQRDRGFARDLHGEFSLQNIHEDLTRRPVKRGLLFGYGAIEENDIGEGLTRLRRALHLVNARL